MLKENRKLLKAFKRNSEYKIAEGGQQNAFGLVEAIVEEGEGEADNAAGEEELYLLKHLQHQPNQSKGNLSRQAPLSQQEADEKVISQQANQTLWLFHNRQDQTLWLFFVAVPLVIPQCIHSQSCTEDGNENPVLHTIPQQPQTSTLSSGSVA